MSDRKPVSSITPFGLRLQPDLKVRLEELAASNNRSLNAEIAQRLQDSVDGGTLAESAPPGMVAATVRLPQTIFNDLSAQARFFGHSLDEELALRLVSTDLGEYVRKANALRRSLEREKYRRRQEVQEVFDTFQRAVDTLSRFLTGYEEQLSETEAGEELESLWLECENRLQELRATIDVEGGSDDV